MEKQADCAGPQTGGAPQSKRGTSSHLQESKTANPRTAHGSSETTSTLESGCSARQERSFETPQSRRHEAANEAPAFRHIRDNASPSVRETGRPAPARHRIQPTRRSRLMRPPIRAFVVEAPDLARAHPQNPMLFPAAQASPKRVRSRLFRPPAPSLRPSIGTDLQPSELPRR